MNDRLKFRAWDGQKMWTRFALSPDGYVLGWDGIKESWVVEMKKWKIMQCTGLKDKNGKLIFEGDILTEHEGVTKRIYQEVYWAEWSPGFRLKQYGPHLKKQGESGGMLHCLFTKEKYKLDGVEIIGNIYENSSLLNPEGV